MSMVMGVMGVLWCLRVGITLRQRRQSRNWVLVCVINVLAHETHVDKDEIDGEVGLKW